METTQDLVQEQVEHLIDEDEEDVLCCSHCGDEIDEDDCKEVDGEMYCQSCYEDKFFVCADCEEEVKRNNGEYINNDGDPICEDCSQYYYSCEYCQSVIHEDNMRVFNDVCICDHCHDRYIRECRECGNEFDSSETGYRCDYCDNWYCGNCGCSCEDEEEEEDDSDSLIHSYSYKPIPCFYGEYPFYGMEIETDKYQNRDKTLEALKSYSDTHDNKIYAKYDGSLENGIEIVTHPFGINHWNEFEDDLDTIVKSVKSGRGKSYDTDTCGIHIHRSSRDVSIIDISKLIWFFVSCKDEIVTLAQRRSNFASFSMNEGSTVKYTFKNVKENKHQWERYQAVNFSNRKTIEFRIFKGTLKIDTIYGYLGFAHYVTDFCKSCLVSDMVNKDHADLWKDFIDFIMVRVHKGEKLAKRLIIYLTRKSLNHYAKNNSEGRV